MTKAWLPISLAVLVFGYGCGGDDGGGSSAASGGSNSAGGATAGGSSAGGSSMGGNASGGMASGGSSVGGGGNPGSCFDTNSPYPSGPYGIEEGDVVADMELEGYVNLEADAISNTKPYTDTSLEALRRTGRCYAVVHVSEFF